jgi:hypothetical protein
MWHRYHALWTSGFAGIPYKGDRRGREPNTDIRYLFSRRRLRPGRRNTPDAKRRPTFLVARNTRSRERGYAIYPRSSCEAALGSEKVSWNCMGHMIPGPRIRRLLMARCNMQNPPNGTSKNLMVTRGEISYAVMTYHTMVDATSSFYELPEDRRASLLTFAPRLTGARIVNPGKHDRLFPRPTTFWNRLKL